MKNGKVSLPKREFRKEHTQLVRVLKSGTKSQRIKEANKQKREL